ncbi:MAG: SRPBCC family protein [Gaiellaceae bacterium]
MTETAPIVRSVDVRSTPERLFELLVDPVALVRWWPDVAELEPREGGSVRMVFGAASSVVNGVVTRYEPPRALGFTWVRDVAPDVTTRVEFSVTDLGDGRCRVEVVHSGWEHAPEARATHDLGWAHFLRCLADLAEGRPVDKSYPRPSTD